MMAFNCYYIILVVCLVSFLTQMVRIFVDYHMGKTAVSIFTDKHDKKQLPCLTFCPLPAFKSNSPPDFNLESDLEEYLASTYGPEDIFSHQTDQSNDLIID